MSVSKSGLQMNEAEPLLTVDLQNALHEREDQGEGEKSDESEEPPSSKAEFPSYSEFYNWAALAYSSCENMPAELCIRLVSSEEMLELNHTYRSKQKTTNVLSFATDIEQEILEVKLLGDVVICHAVVIQEAQDQGKSLLDHYAHLVTHGVLHLCGYDHETDQDALLMESLEQQLLARQGIANPYA